MAIVEIPRFWRMVSCAAKNGPIRKRPLEGERCPVRARVLYMAEAEATNIAKGHPQGTRETRQSAVCLLAFSIALLLF